MKNIALVGFMGTGKTTVARLLAQQLGAVYVDLDERIEKKTGMAIVDIFREKGEPYFRAIEKEIVAGAAAEQGLVIACGGGVVLDEANIHALKKNGVVVCLEARPDIILERTKSYVHRPLLNVPDPEMKITELLIRRKPFYAKADFSIDTSLLSVEEVAAIVARWVKGV
jgi:shikimate kinase